MNESGRSNSHYAAVSIASFPELSDQRDLLRILSLPQRLDDMLGCIPGIPRIILGPVFRPVQYGLRRVGGRGAPACLDDNFRHFYELGGVIRYFALLVVRRDHIAGRIDKACNPSKFRSNLRRRKPLHGGSQRITNSGGYQAAKNSIFQTICLHIPGSLLLLFPTAILYNPSANVSNSTWDWPGRIFDRPPPESPRSH